MVDDLPPDDKDWTWAAIRPCPDCGFDPVDHTPPVVSRRVRGWAGRFVEFLAAPDAAVRPWPTQWSALEYSAHVCDVLEIFDDRLALMLATDPFGDPARFENWDQDAASGSYASLDPATVATRITANAERIAWRFGTVGPGDLRKQAIRSNGSEFTIATFTPYFAHDLVHHIRDVERGNAALRGEPVG